MKWSPNGQILLTCAKEETVKLWAAWDCDSGHGSGWSCLQSLRHPSLVNSVAWCGLSGRGPQPLSMLAMYVTLNGSVPAHIRTLSCSITKTNAW